MCESDDGQDDLTSRSAEMCESDQTRMGTHPVVAQAAPTILDDQRRGPPGSTPMRRIYRGVISG